MNVSFILPCLNAESIIENSIKKLKKKINTIKKINYELILIDDGSTDSTSKIIKKFKKKNIKLLVNSKNLGKSESLMKGIKIARYEKIIICDCDLPYFKYLDKLINLLRTNNLVYINRRSSKSKLEKKKMNFYQISRYFIGSMVCFILNYLLLDKKTGDTQAGLKGFNKPKNFHKINFLSKKFFFDAELMILFYRSKTKMASIPLKYKIYEDSTIKIFALENFVYLFELIKVILFYKFFTNKKIIL